MATIAVDFDGTIVTHEYPKIGTELPFATETLKMLIRDHHKLILWSVREGKLLDEAVEWCRERGVEFWAVNKDYPEESLENNNHFSRKLKADWFIDDRGIGGLPDWGDLSDYHQPYQLSQSTETEVRRTAGSSQKETLVEPQITDKEDISPKDIIIDTIKDIPINKKGVLLIGNTPFLFIGMNLLV